MARCARSIVPDCLYHITQRGNYKQTVFYNDLDRIHYLSLLREACLKWETKILAYCLMNNHVHFIAIPEKEDSFAKTFSVTHMRYSHYKNGQLGKNGHFWQGRYYSKELNEGHLHMAVKYVEQNPVRAGYTRHPWDWPWSSARAHLGKEKPAIPLADVNEYLDVESWKEYLLEYE